MRALAAIVLVVSLQAACAADRSNEPPTPSNTWDASVLTVLTWNIWMMPRFTFQSPENTRRAAAIADVLAEQDADILCLEKAFDGSARKVIAARLHGKYPYMFGPINRRFGLKVNGGVWVLSRIPLTGYREIEFHKAIGIERLSRKGAMFLSGSFGNQPFILIVTHLEGEEGAVFTTSHQMVRDAQVEQIAHDLLTPPPKHGILVVIAGDFATPRLKPGSATEESEPYKNMLAKLQALNGPGYRITLDDNRAVNTLAQSNSGRTDELDYVLMRDNGVAIQTSWERRILRKSDWDGEGNRPDLSYRYTVVATIRAHK
jgi:endonuclease/exonuclease/phosphatase family metal-dependent hydrolase